MRASNFIEKHFGNFRLIFQIRKFYILQIKYLIVGIKILLNYNIVYTMTNSH